jgi:hypothetical protein
VEIGIVPGLVWLVVAILGYVVLDRVTRQNERTLEHFHTFGKRALWLAYGTLLVAVVPGLQGYIEEKLPQIRWVYETAIIFLPLLFACGITYVTIYYSSGRWYDVFSRFQRLGIVGGEPSRKGREVQQTNNWLNEIREAKESVVLSGVTLGGWFVTAWDSLPDDLFNSLNAGVKYEIYLANPEKSGFKLRAKDKGEVNEPRDSADKRIIDVLDHIRYFFTEDKFSNHLENLNLCFRLYSGTPLAIISIDDTIYFTPYLPFIPDRQCPLLQISRHGEFAKQIIVSLDKIRDDEETERLENLEQLDALISRINDRQAAAG